ncbi:HD domain-containing protein [Photobacterium sp. SDRW27]|uniref:HD-GYP domain-containing protein n=1 Tax=Photobacterium obscurum TaxID=2829490 RepID=UPI0022430BCE|nr:HD domain-containing phosphohydrolase [Photobacterium obscurum]MCW8329397.1 HD domain-containing protein [Photobacterium obscurum]
MGAFSKSQIDLRQMIIAIEAAVSLVGMNDTNHGKRVGYIASQIGRQLGFKDDALQFAFELGLLHDCGVSTEMMHSKLVSNLFGNDTQHHCEVGYHLLKQFEPLSDFALPILHHHTPWQQLKELNIDMQSVIMANLIFLSDRVDILAAPYYEKGILQAREEIVQTIENYEETHFDPLIVSAFKRAEKSEAFWIALEDRHITRYTWDIEKFKSNRPLLNVSQLKQLSMIMACIVDQKSPYTAQHSIRVAKLARYLASHFGLSPEQCDKIEIAGLLHDLGKLHIPDKILEKPCRLNDLERSIFKQHSFETYEILRHIKGFEEIARWAAYHHEGLHGIGYPFHPSNKDLSIEARVLAVADVFQVLVQGTPYQHSMPLDKAIETLDDLARQGKLEPNIVNLLKQNQKECFAIVQGNKD